MRFAGTKVESQIVSKAKANYLRGEVEIVELERFPETEVESYIAGKAIAKNYLLNFKGE